MSFNIDQEVDTTQSVYYNFNNLPLTNILLNNTNAIVSDSTTAPNNTFIQADVTETSSSNLTYTNNNASSEYRSTAIYITGSSDGSMIPQITGIQSPQQGQLIIINTLVSQSSTNPETIKMIFPLIVTSVAAEQNDLDLVFRSAQPMSITDASGNKQTNTNGGSATINIQKTLDEQIKADTKYFIFDPTADSTDGGISDTGNAKVVIFGGIYYIISVSMYTLRTPVANELDDWPYYQPNTNSYNTILATQPGQWMECDYVDVDSDNVAVTLSSGKVQDDAAYNSLRTMMMYILFIIFTAFSYTLIPQIYILMLKAFFAFMEAETKGKQSRAMESFDLGALIFFFVLCFLFIAIGISQSPLLLLYGVCLGILTMLGHIIIKSKKSMASAEEWPITEIQLSNMRDSK